MVSFVQFEHAAAVVRKDRVRGTVPSGIVVGCSWEVRETWGPEVGSTHPHDVHIKARLNLDKIRIRPHLPAPAACQQASVISRPQKET